jgi:hypothetical protein
LVSSRRVFPRPAYTCSLYHSCSFTFSIPLTTPIHPFLTGPQAESARSSARPSPRFNLALFRIT